MSGKILRERCNDIACSDDFGVADAGRIYRKALTVCMIFGIAILLIRIFAVGQVELSWIRETRYAQAFNSCTVEERRVMAEKGLSTYNLAGVNGSYFIVIKDKPPSVSEFLARIWRKYVLWMLVISVLVAMVRTFYSYACYKKQKYFYADFPGAPAERRRLVALTLIFFPVYLVSYHHMQRWKKQEALKYYTDDYKFYEDTAASLASRFYDAAATAMAEDYGKFRQGVWQRDYLNKMEQLEDSIKNAKEAVERTCEVYDKAKAELAEFEAQYAKLAAEPPAPLKFGEAELEDDLKEISRMRGVTDVRVCDCTPVEVVIAIDVKVRIPYNGETYMAGDYTIFLSSGNGSLWTIQRNTCGLVRDYDNHPHYYSSPHQSFCFGNRTDNIRAYLKAGEVVTAVSLMIDGMHSVAENDQPYIPQCYRRVVQV